MNGTFGGDKNKLADRKEKKIKYTTNVNKSLTKNIKAKSCFYSDNILKSGSFEYRSSLYKLVKEENMGVFSAN